MISKKETYFNTSFNPLILGRIGSAYGIYGWLKIFSFTEYSEDIFKYQPWFIQRFTHWQELELEGWKNHKENYIIKIKYINDRSTANSIINCNIIIDSVQLPILETNEYYWKDLIGCQVINTKGYSLGYVYNLMETGSNDVLIIKGNLKNKFGGKECLIPFLNHKIIKSVNLTTKIIKVDWNPNF